MGIDNNSIYTEKEQAILEKTISVRSRIVDELTKDGQVPYKSGDIRVLNEVMNSLDVSVNNSANTRLKSEDTKNNAQLHEMVAAMLNQIDVNSDNKAVNDVVEVELLDEYIPDDTVPGEMDINPETLDTSMFVGDNDDT